MSNNLYSQPFISICIWFIQLFYLRMFKRSEVWILFINKHILSKFTFIYELQLVLYTHVVSWMYGSQLHLWNVNLLPNYHRGTRFLLQIISGRELLTDKVICDVIFAAECEESVHHLALTSSFSMVVWSFSEGKRGISSHHSTLIEAWTNWSVHSLPSNLISMWDTCHIIII